MPLSSETPSLINTERCHKKRDYSTIPSCHPELSSRVVLLLSPVGITIICPTSRPCRRRPTRPRLQVGKCLTPPLRSYLCMYKYLYGYLTSLRSHKEVILLCMMICRAIQALKSAINSLLTPYTITLSISKLIQHNHLSNTRRH